jgi:hypothetical protein
MHCLLNLSRDVFVNWRRQTPNTTWLFKRVHTVLHNHSFRSMDCTTTLHLQKGNFPLQEQRANQSLPMSMRLGHLN